MQHITPEMIWLALREDAIKKRRSGTIPGTNIFYCAVDGESTIDWFNDFSRSVATQKEVPSHLHGLKEVLLTQTGGADSSDTEATFLSSELLEAHALMPDFSARINELLYASSGSGLLGDRYISLNDRWAMPVRLEGELNYFVMELNRADRHIAPVLAMLIHSYDLAKQKSAGAPITERFGNLAEAVNACFEKIDQLGGDVPDSRNKYMRSFVKIVGDSINRFAETRTDESEHVLHCFPGFLSSCAEYQMTSKEAISSLNQLLELGHHKEVKQIATTSSGASLIVAPVGVDVLKEHIYVAISTISQDDELGSTHTYHGLWTVYDTSFSHVSSASRLMAEFHFVDLYNHAKNCDCSDEPGYQAALTDSANRFTALYTSLTNTSDDLISGIAVAAVGFLREVYRFESQDAVLDAVVELIRGAKKHTVDFGQDNNIVDRLFQDVTDEIKRHDDISPRTIFHFINAHAGIGEAAMYLAAKKRRTGKSNDEVDIESRKDMIYPKGEIRGKFPYEHLLDWFIGGDSIRGKFGSVRIGAKLSERSLFGNAIMYDANMQRENLKDIFSDGSEITHESMDQFAQEYLGFEQSRGLYRGLVSQGVNTINLKEVIVGCAEELLTTDLDDYNCGLAYCLLTTDWSDNRRQGIRLGNLYEALEERNAYRATFHAKRMLDDRPEDYVADVFYDVFRDLTEGRRKRKLFGSKKRNTVVGDEYLESILINGQIEE